MSGRQIWKSSAAKSSQCFKKKCNPMCKSIRDCSEFDKFHLDPRLQSHSCCVSESCQMCDCLDSTKFAQLRSYLKEHCAPYVWNEAPDEISVCDCRKHFWKHNLKREFKKDVVIRDHCCPHCGFQTKCYIGFEVGKRLLCRVRKHDCPLCNAHAFNEAAEETDLP